MKPGTEVIFKTRGPCNGRVTLRGRFHGIAEDGRLLIEVDAEEMPFDGGLYCVQAEDVWEAGSGYESG